MPKNFIDPHLPIPFRISNWDNGDRILYKCPKCHASFQIFGNLEKYCHNCGTKIEWRFSPTFLDTEEKAEYDSYQEDCPPEEVLAFLCILYRKAKRRKKKKQKWRRRNDLVKKNIF